jgi:biopolymer transport protein ExbD
MEEVSAIVNAMVTLILAAAILQDVCPMTIGVSADGTIFSNRFHGWYEVSPGTLERDLHGGCYNDANPSHVTSVQVAVAAHAPEQKVALVFSILKKEGWNRNKVKIQSWEHFPGKPH